MSHDGWHYYEVSMKVHFANFTRSYDAQIVRRLHAKNDKTAAAQAWADVLEVTKTLCTLEDVQVGEVLG